MQHEVVSREEWVKARKAHLKNEKALTRIRDLVSAERRTLPWVKNAFLLSHLTRDDRIEFFK